MRESERQFVDIAEELEMESVEVMNMLIYCRTFLILNLCSSSFFLNLCSSLFIFLSGFFEFCFESMLKHNASYRYGSIRLLFQGIFFRESPTSPAFAKATLLVE